MTTPAKPTLAAALVAAQAEMPAIDKDGANPHFNSKFVTLDNLIAQTRPVLNRHGLSISQLPGGTSDAPTLTTILSHESGERLENVTPLILAKQDMQALGSAITYARRYAWAAALGIASDEDDDHQAASDRAERPSRARETAPRALGWGPLMKALDGLGLPEADAKVWLEQATKAAGIDMTDTDGKKSALAKANVMHGLLVELGGVQFQAGIRPALMAMFAKAYGVPVGAVEGPVWRISPDETGLLSREEWVESQKASGAADGDDIAF